MTPDDEKSHHRHRLPQFRLRISVHVSAQGKVTHPRDSSPRSTMLPRRTTSVQRAVRLVMEMPKVPQGTGVRAHVGTFLRANRRERARTKLGHKQVGILA